MSTFKQYLNFVLFLYSKIMLFSKETVIVDDNRDGTNYILATYIQIVLKNDLLSTMTNGGTKYNYNAA